MRPKLSVQRNSDGGLGGRSSYLGRIIAQCKTRQLQVATGGKFKYLVSSKIINLLKTAYLEEREMRPTLNQLLEKVNEFHVSDDIKEWLAEDILKNHPRVRLVRSRNDQREIRYAYEPPLKACSSQQALLKTLKAMHINGDGGLLRSLVEDSVSIADRIITNLVDEGKIIQVTGLDKRQVLFYKPPEPELDKCVADNRFIELWRKIDVCNKEMSHIKNYLRIQHMYVLDDDALTAGALKKRKAEEEILEKTRTGQKSKRQRKSRRLMLKDNAHIQDELIVYGED